MKDQFEFAGGSIIGRSHRIAGKNNQDACACLNWKGYSIAVVCDGCGSGEHSEVGAQIGARLVAHTIMRLIEQSAACDESPPLELIKNSFWERVRHDILARLLLLAEDIGDNLAWVVSNYLLFTIVGVFITPTRATFFSIGDGVLFINGSEITLGPFPDNAPPYLSYGLVETDSAAPSFQVRPTLPTSKLQSFLIGTDGTHDLIKAAPRNLPGKSEAVGQLSQFWQEDAYFSNPDMIRRRLAGANRDVTATDRTTGSLCKSVGLLPDDTTFIVGRRKGRYES